MSARARTAVLAALLAAGCSIFADLPLEPELDCNKVPANPPDQLVRACVLRASCSPFLPKREVGECIAEARPMSTPYDLCTADAKGCGDIAACTGLARLTEGSCTGRKDGWHCQGATAVRCGFGEPYMVDCGARGATCKLYSGADKSSFWPCELPADTPCAADKTWHCQGDKLVYCAGSDRWGEDCGARGMRCVKSGSSAGCTSLAKPCTGAKRCEGDVAVSCTSWGAELRLDCGLGGGNCKDGRCVTIGCDDQAYESCRVRCVDETHLRTCLYGEYGNWGGHPLIIDCTAYGFERCVLEKSSTRTWRVCR